MAIETDRALVLSGLRGGLTLGSPLAFTIENRDYENWQQGMDPFEGDVTYRQVVHPRPGHADLPGALKYGFEDMRPILERSSARETAARVAVGSIARQLLAPFGIEAACHVISIGSEKMNGSTPPYEALKAAEDSPVRCIDDDAATAMMTAIDQAKKQGDSLGGVVEVQVKG